MIVRVLATFGVALSVLLAGPALVAAPHAQADEVATAEARVAELQRQIRRTTDRLINGTERWERDQAALRTVERRYAVVLARVARQEAAVEQGRAKVAVVARRMYMHPVGDQLRLALGMTPDQVLGLLQTQGQLDKVAGSDTEIVRRARLAQLSLERTRADAMRLAHNAKRLADSSADRMHELQALAADTSRQLSAASRALGQARAREAARLAKLARVRPAQGALCSTASTAGQSNGQLDAASLCPLWQARGQRMRTDASRWFNKMSIYHKQTTGRPLCVTDSYRSYSQQVDVYQRKPGLAAVPGTSRHGWGVAVDLGCGVQQFGSANYRWMQANARRFHFVHPAWAEPSGSMPEAWHWEYTG
ncbi:MAG TPA: M15 family metallopeptidase [Mycobacteriales bacterium]|nr:M15 family metallopeptidase [Mycobacteriales bacterium]